MDRIEGSLHRLGAAFVSGLHEPAYQLISTTEWGRTAQTYTMAGTSGPAGRWPTLELNEAMAALPGGMAIEVIGDPAGDYTVHWSRDGASLPARVVLDEGYRFPGHERPSPRTPGVSDRRPTDPLVLATMRDLVAEFVSKHQPEGYPPGCSEEEILATEDQLGVRLPEDLRALYRIIHDDRAETGLLDPFVLAPLTRLAEWNAANHPGYHDDLFDDPLIVDCHPHGHVRRVSSSNGWITFAGDYGMNFAAVDLDPGPLGRRGQVVQHGRDVWAPVEYVIGSVRDLLRRAIDTLDEERAGPPGPRWSGASMAEEPSVVQIADMHEVTELRFADLANFPKLKSIFVRSTATQVDMTFPPALHIEQVHVTATAFDPADLTRTPGVPLTDVRLAGNDVPASIACLASLPDLLRLDLAEAQVADIEAIAKFPALRVLTLNTEQWTRLLATGWRPGSLAAAQLGGRAGVADATRWRTALGLNASHRTLHGHRPTP